MKFTYGSGERVLDGYTLKRGIGRGGFGEVYYAVSDGGKEVALKLVRGANLDVELRGMAQCLNLKHTNLLALYDIRSDAQGDHWVVMEYVTGEPLSAVLTRHPQGLTPETARHWFRDMAAGVGYLHAHGIVHRDLKPGNIFVENGQVKVGDYGLSKFMSSSRHGAQTQSIGTVHYMAPEISTGNYNKQIDVYALGVILYEMLTGHVPFDGESAGEILMKHLTSPPDLSKLPPAFAAVVGKALAKNPAQRYSTMAELAKAVDTVCGPAPRVSPSVDPPIRPAPSAPVVSTPVRIPAPPEPAPSATRPVTVRGRVGDLCGSLALATLFAAVGCLVWVALAQVNERAVIGVQFLLTVATCWAVLIPATIWNGHAGDTGFRRVIMLVLGLLVGVGGLWLEHGTSALMPGGTAWARGARDRSVPWGELQALPLAAGYVAYFAFALAAMRWWKLVERRRRQRFSFGPILAAAFWAFVLLAVWPKSEDVKAALPILLASAIVQLVSPWEQPAPPPARRMRLRYT